MRLDPLSRLAIRHGSDKFGGHLYTPSYHRLLGHLREQPIALLELGIGGYDVALAGGSSLRMWAEYFPEARIVGLDIAGKTLDISPRVTIVQGSQADPALLGDLIARHGPFDVVIDDGSHHVPHVLDSFRFLYPRMAPDGIYIVEDTQTAFVAGSGGNAEGQGTIFTLAQDLALSMHRREGFSRAGIDPDIVSLGHVTHSVTILRNIIVFQRGDNRYPSNMAFDLDDPLADAVDRAMDREAGRNPAPRATLGRIDMAIWAGRPRRAGEIALAASQSYPHDPCLHAELVRLMEWAGESAARETLSARLAALTAR